MVLGLLTRLPAAGLGVALSAPGYVARGAAACATVAGDAVGLGLRAASDGAAAVADTSVHVAHVARNALPGGTEEWRAGSRVHLALRPSSDARVRRAGGIEAVAKKVATTLAERPDVLLAYWDGGLARLVVTASKEAATDRVVEKATALAERYGLTHEEGPLHEFAHPEGTTAVRVAATALAMDAVGVAAAVTGRMLRVPRSSRVVTAGVTMVRENPRFRALLSTRLGAAGADLALAAANAAVHSAGQSPTSLVLDGMLRAGQLVESVARAAVFDAAHDRVCAPDRASVTGREVSRPPLRPTPAQEYAAHAATGSMAGAAATLLLRRNLNEAAEAVLSGSPKAARYGPAAFSAALGSAMARTGILVRDPERLKQLQLVDTVVLHPSALRGSKRALCEVNPSAEDWDRERLWRAAAAALAQKEASSAGEEEAAPGDDENGERPSEASEVELRPVPGGEPSAQTGMMIVSADGRDVGTVTVSWELDPLTEAVLDAARQADQYTVVVDDPALGDFAALADEVVSAEYPLAEHVRRRQDDGHVVLTVVRVPGVACAPAPEGPATAPADDAAGSRGAQPAHQGHDAHRDHDQDSEEDAELLAGLLSSDVAVAVTDEGSAVVWDADALVFGGLKDVWRLLVAVPVARSVGRQSQILARAGAALSGLLVATGTQRRGLAFLTGSQHAPVNAAALGALVTGWAAALRVAAASTPQPRPRVPWHALESDEAVARLRDDRPEEPTALAGAMNTTRAVAGRVAGHPVLAPARWSVRLANAVRAELDDPLTPVLAVGAAASAIVGSAIDAGLVVGAMGMNALVGGVQRQRAEQALAALATGQKQKARRTDERGESVTTVDAARLDPGDIIKLEVGDVVPADARLLELSGLEVDESSLTGESLPTTKQLSATPQAAIADRGCMVFEGTTVVAGQATAVVVDTGEHTEAGRAVALASRTPPAEGVQGRLQELTSKALPLTLAGGAAVTGLSLLRGRPIREAVGGGVAVAVAAVPEGLPLVATVAQLAAARRLTRRGILVRTPRALEALGRVDTVCFDKTGTLTENRLHVDRLTTADGTVCAPDEEAAVDVLRLAGRACPPEAEDTNGRQAHATDEAVLAAAPADPDWTPTAGLPFEASRGYTAAIGGTGTGGSPLLVVKGAPETVLNACADLPAEAAEWAQSLAGEGLRVLAVATRSLTGGHDADMLVNEPLAKLEFAGFVALADAPRPGSAAMVQGLREAGATPVMLTGDHPHTARAVAVALGWPADTGVITGAELAAADRAGRARLLSGAGVVARVAPEQKLQVVEALRAAGRVVAMVGDGANDAAAIRAAHVGVGLAARGSAAARNAADLVLTDPELSVLVDAVREGRALWRSVADAISILIGGNAGEVGFTVLGTLFAGASPLSTRQLLLVNLLTDMFPAMAVAVTPPDEHSAEEDATPGSEPVGTSALGAPLLRQIRQRGIVTALGATVAWLIGRFTPGTARRTSTMALCGVVGAQLTQTLIGRQRSPLLWATTLGSAAALMAVVQTPGVSHFFGCTPLGPVACTGVAAAIATTLLGPRVMPPVERLVTGLQHKFQGHLSTVGKAMA